MNKTQKNVSELLKLLSSCKDYQQIIDTAAEYVGFPMLLYDIAYVKWAHSQAEIDDPLWIEFSTTGTFSPKTVAFVQKHFVDSYNNSSVIAPMKSLLKHNRVNGGIFDKNGVQIANVVMMETGRPFEELDHELLRALCGFIGKRIEDSDMAIQSRLFGETIIDELIEGREIPDSDLSFKKLKSSTKDVLYVAVVDIMAFDPTLTHIVYFSEHLKKLRPDFKYFVHLNNIIILMTFPEIVQNIHKELNVFEVFFEEFALFAGVSSPFFDIKKLKTHFKQAVNALNYGMMLGTCNHIFSYDIFRTELFIGSHLDEAHVNDICHPLVHKIYQHDKDYNTSYIELIYTYLLRGLDSKLAANSLSITLSEFNACIKKATKLFDIDFRNGNLMFVIMASIKIIKCFPERIATHHDN